MQGRTKLGKPIVKIKDEDCAPDPENSGSKLCQKVNS